MNNKIENEVPVSFTVECKMLAHQAASFIDMLNYMQEAGKCGKSKSVTFVCNGEDDFHPSFIFTPHVSYNEGVKPGYKGKDCGLTVNLSLTGDKIFAPQLKGDDKFKN